MKQEIINRIKQLGGNIANVKGMSLQDDLCAIVPQSNLSAILSGKRKISATLAGKLGKFFGVSPAIFVPR